MHLFIFVSLCECLYSLVHLFIFVSLCECLYICIYTLVWCIKSASTLMQQKRVHTYIHTCIYAYIYAYTHRIQYNAGLAEGKAAAVASQWNKYLSSLSRSMVDQTFSVNKLEDLEWRFGVTAASSELEQVYACLLHNAYVCESECMQVSETCVYAYRYTYIYMYMYIYI